MKSSPARRALGVSFIYIGVLFGLVLLQFGRGGGFSFREGRLSVTATLPRSGGNPESVRVAWPGLVLELSPTSPAVYTDAAGSRRNLQPRGIERSGDGVRVQLQGGVELLVSPSSSTGFSLVARGGSGFRSLSLTCKLSGGSALEQKGGKRLFKAAGSTWSLDLPAGSYDAEQKRLVLDPRGGTQAGFALALVERPRADQKPVAVARAAEDPAVYAAKIGAWTELLWNGLKGERWDEASASWREADGSPVFSETALAVWLAEGYERNQAPTALARARVAARVHQGSLTWLTVPYLGDTVRQMQGMEAQDLVERKRLATLLDAKDPSLFEKEGLVHFLVDRTPIDFARSVLAFAASLDPAKLDREQALGILGCAVESASLLGKEENPFPALVATDRIVADIRETDSGLFLVTGDDGASDLRLSLKAGGLLVAWGQANGQSGLVGLGQGLVEGVLALADAKGFVPARAVPRSGSLEERSGLITPERIYPLVAAGKYWPRELSFYRQSGPGVWAWTCAPALSLTSSGGRVVYDASFPTGFEHYLNLYGVKPFANIKLYGIDYRPDPRFETYNASGFYYRAGSAALHVKMKHKKDDEFIELGYLPAAGR